MKYENAKNILPEKLLAEVQKYGAGKVIYIPKKSHITEGKSYIWEELLQLEVVN